MTRQALVVLGMHRSGTSALTRVLSLLGAGLPKTLMPSHADNPKGYWESQPVARFNNRLLASAGRRWDADAPIPAAWFADEAARAPQREEARALIRAEYDGAKLLVFKDPRLCLLYPFWERVLEDEGIACKVLLCLRDPMEVADSLASRFQDSRLHPAAIPSRSRALLLWLRHVLDAERATRHLKRLAVDYSALLFNWRTALLSLSLPWAGLAWPGPQDPLGQEIDLFLNPELRRHDRALRGPCDDEPTAFVLDVMEVLKAGEASGPSLARLDALSHDLDRLLADYAPLRATVDRLSQEDPWSDRILVELQDLHYPPPPAALAELMSAEAKPTVLFVSPTSDSRAHRYRIEHPLAQLLERGWNAEWRSASDPAVLEAVGQADVVVASRGPLGAIFEDIRESCRARQVPLVCDVDDLMFEPSVLEAGYVEHFNRRRVEKRATSLKDAQELQSALRNCDAVFATTAPLARAAAKHAPRAFVLPNCFGYAMLASAAASLAAPKPSSLDGLLRVGFASGTPTHSRDFGTIVESLADFLAANPSARLVVLGHLNLAPFPTLSGLGHQIECRPGVSLDDLSSELARFDINLAPLEVGNPFCEAKSEIRFTAASALGIPTIAAATAPLSRAIMDGVSGFLARSAPEWRQRLQQLADDPALRRRLGEAARVDTRARFGPEKTARLVERHLATLLASRLSPRKANEGASLS